MSLSRDLLLDAARTRRRHRRLVQAGFATLPIAAVVATIFWKQASVAPSLDHLPFVAEILAEKAVNPHWIESEDELFETLAGEEPLLITDPEGKKHLFVSGSWNG